MTTFIITPNGDGYTVTPWDGATPSDRKHHRATGAGFTVNARDEDAVRRCLDKYF